MQGAIESVNTTKLIRKQGIIMQDMGRETLLCSAKGKAVHVLNPTAKLLWELCDGGHTRAEMEQVIRARFAIPDDHNVAEDVRHTLEVFVTKGIVEEKRL
ncbi:MAG: hypothetical protein AYP45_17640 [Candidatus Brocadia carolinensis]|uniref:PqqD family protein n=1 Tax=Candidatus Brocadia carolinensis TaxID=1004156 RepID=A0A1V4AP88_9BACT|nr:MAG: hypothetical protein AYP45_17640 [Candidatus Brocadia caroliniensis]